MAHEAWKHAYFSNKMLLTHLATKLTFKSKISITDKEFSSFCEMRPLGKMNFFRLFSSFALHYGGMFTLKPSNDTNLCTEICQNDQILSNELGNKKEI